jgi:DNA-binding transcriptional ArsR family regulator
MSAESDLARAIARALLDSAERQDADEEPVLAEDEELPPISDMATSQRAVLGALAAATHRGLTAREIADRTEVTQFNVYEKLGRLTTMGYVEEIPESTPKRWRLTPRARKSWRTDDGAA